MHFQKPSIAAQLLLLGATLTNLCAAVPVQDSPRQRLLDGHSLPSRYRKALASSPYGPGNEDPLDRPIDSVGDDLDPLPYRNGLGASVLGPWNRDRARQNPDLVRPPSTDRGNLPNMRWSFVDSHIRIEVSQCSNILTRLLQLDPIERDVLISIHRRVAGLGRPPFGSSAAVLSSLA
jgi:hypothetical protein